MPNQGPDERATCWANNLSSSGNWQVASLVSKLTAVVKHDGNNSYCTTVFLV